MDTLKIIFVCITLSKVVVANPNPCPGIFAYSFDNAQKLIGVIRSPIPQNFGNLIKLDVEFTVGNIVQGYIGKIELWHSNEVTMQNIIQRKPIYYKLHFPTWEKIIPHVTKILVNGKLICSGNPIKKKEAKIVTTVTLKHSLHVINSNSVNNLPENYNIHQPAPTQPPPSLSVPQVNDNQNVYFFGGPGNTNSADNINSVIQNVLEDRFHYQNPSQQNFFHQPSSTPAAFFPATFPKATFPPATFPPATFPTSTFPTSKFPTATFPPVTFSQETSPQPNLPSRLNPTTNSNEFLASLDNICGVADNSVTLIAHGEETARAEYPWLGALFKASFSESNFICGSNLISKRHAISAGHCVHGVRATRLYVILGRENINNWLSEGVQMQVIDTYLHPDYVSKQGDGDLAILKLKEEIRITSTVRPICIWRYTDDLRTVVGRNGLVVGWGRDENKSFTSKPRKAVLPIVSGEDCLRSNPGFNFITSNRTFCAGFRNDSGPCNGDSGSGFYLEENGKWLLRGIVSISLLANDTCDLKNFVVFVDTAKFTNWILSYIINN